MRLQCIVCSVAWTATCTQVNMRLDQMSVQCPCLLSLSALPVPSSALSMQMYSMICVYACRFSVEICSNLCDNSHKCQSACLACSSCAPLLAKKLVGSYSGVFACKRKAKLTSIAVSHVHSLLRLGLPASELEGGSQERLKVPASWRFKSRMLLHSLLFEVASLNSHFCCTTVDLTTVQFDTRGKSGSRVESRPRVVFFLGIGFPWFSHLIIEFKQPAQLLARNVTRGTS